MSENKEDSIINLGYMNGWAEEPEAYKEHIRLTQEEGEKHETSGYSPYRCVTTTICKTCGIEWSVDSGD